MNARHSKYCAEYCANYHIYSKSIYMQWSIKHVYLLFVHVYAHNGRWSQRMKKFLNDITAVKEPYGWNERSKRVFNLYGPDKCYELTNMNNLLCVTVNKLQVFPLHSLLYTATAILVTCSNTYQCSSLSTNSLGCRFMNTFISFLWKITLHCNFKMLCNCALTNFISLSSCSNLIFSAFCSCSWLVRSFICVSSWQRLWSYLPAASCLSFLSSSKSALNTSACRKNAW